MNEVHGYYNIMALQYHRAWRHSASLMSLERLAKDALRAAGSQRRFDVAGKSRCAADIEVARVRTVYRTEDLTNEAVFIHASAVLEQGLVAAEDVGVRMCLRCYVHVRDQRDAVDSDLGDPTATAPAASAPTATAPPAGQQQ